MSGFGEFKIAAGMRDAIEHIATRTIEQKRPLPRIGKIKDINPTQLEAEVSFAGDKGSIWARYGVNLQPRTTNAIVRVAGKPGDYYITEILNEEASVAAYEPVKLLVDENTGTSEVTGDYLIAGGVAPKIITGESLSEDVILSTSRIAAVGPAGQSVELNPLGFFVYGPDSEGNPTYVEFPTQGGIGGKPNIISGTLQATTLSVDGDPVTGSAATFRRNNQLETSATFTLNDQVGPPVAMPIFESVINEVMSTQDITGYLAGACYVAAEDSIYFLTSRHTGGLWETRIYKTDLATDVTTNLFTIGYSGGNYRGRGLAYIGGKFYVGYQVPGQYGDNIVFVRYNTTAVPGSWTEESHWQDAGRSMTSYGWTLGSDPAGNLWFAEPTDNTVVSYKYSIGGTASNMILTEVSATAYPWDIKGSSQYAEIFTINPGKFDYGSPSESQVFTYKRTYVEGGLNKYAYDMRVWGAEAGSGEFNLMRNTDIPLLVWRGTSNDDTAGRFVGLTMNGTNLCIHRYSKYRVTTGRSTYWYAGSSFYRSSDGAETVMSPQATLIMNSRWNWKVTVATPPSGLGARVYVGTAAGQPASRLQATLAPGVTAYTSDLIDWPGAPAKVSGTFAAQTPAIILSQAETTTTVKLDTTSGSPTLATHTSTVGMFRPWMKGKKISGAGIPAGATILSYNSPDSLTLSTNATATATNVVATLTIPRMEMRGDGYALINELHKVIIAATEDVTANAGNQPPLRIGSITGLHMRLDGNELQAMTNDSTPGSLVLNQGGGDVLLGGSGTQSIELRGTTAKIQGRTIKEWNWGVITDSTNTNGDLVINHGLSTNPDTVFVVGQGQESVANFYMPWDKLANTFKVRCRNDAGTVLTSGVSRTVAWLAIRTT